MANALKMNLFKGGIFKQVKYLFSTPVRSQGVIKFTEVGTVVRAYEPVPAIGYARNMEEEGHPSWLDRHELMVGIEDEDGDVSDEKFLVITERDTVPLDVLNQLSKKEREELFDLEQLAQESHNNAWTRIMRDNSTGNPEGVLRIATINMVVTGLMVGIKLFVK